MTDRCSPLICRIRFFFKFLFERKRQIVVAAYSSIFNSLAQVKVPLLNFKKCADNFLLIDSIMRPRQLVLLGCCVS
jgi:S-ribosylhomocysteine lyase LuxS involved in autoinducer biosynthesis